MNFHNPNMLPLFTICKKGSSIKDCKRFLSQRSKKVPQSRIKEGSSIKESLHKKVPQSRNLYMFESSSSQRELDYCDHKNKCSSFLTMHQFNIQCLRKFSTKKTTFKEIHKMLGIKSAQQAR